MNIAELKGKKVAAAVSGGLDSCTIVRWLADHDVEVICYTGDLGQTDETDLGEVQKRLLASGATEAHIIEGKEQMAKAGCLAIQANAVYERDYWNVTGIGRHVLTSILIEELRKQDISVLIHGATGRGNDQVRFQLIANMLNPNIIVYAPWRDPAFLEAFGGRKQMIDFCEKRNLPIKHSHEKPYSTDANLLGLTHEAGKLESLEVPAHFVKPEMGMLPEDASTKVEAFSVRFERGWPVIVNGKKVNPLSAFATANEVAGKNGVGIGVHLVENRFVGVKSRGVYEQPGIQLLGDCYKYLFQLMFDSRATDLYDQLSTYIGKQIYQGYWFDTGSQAAMAAISKYSDLMTGTISVNVSKGNVSFKSAENIPHNLYSEEDASMESIGEFNHVDSEGFLRILGISAKALSVNKQIGPPYF